MNLAVSVILFLIAAYIGMMLVKKLA